ncbi:hypothetical protein ACSSV1_004897 [Labrenzia sp. MBR-25]
MSRRYSMADLNDLLRTTFLAGRVVLTQGIAALDDEDREVVLTQVREFSDFNEDNDPYGQRDFGAFTHEAAGKVFWKIDYYDLDYKYLSPDPADPQVTRRVLTIMLADEY